MGGGDHDRGEDEPGAAEELAQKQRGGGPAFCGAAGGAEGGLAQDQVAAGGLAVLAGAGQEVLGGAQGDGGVAQERLLVQFGWEFEGLVGFGGGGSSPVQAGNLGFEVVGVLA